MEKLVKVTILSSIFVRGEMFKEGQEVEVNEREAKELLARGVATDEAEIGIEEDPTIPLEKMKRDELLAYAKKLGLEVSTASSLIPGSTFVSKLSLSGLSPLAVALFFTVPAKTSFSVTV